MGKAHVVMVPFPVPGHIIPLLELAKILATHHIRITFVNVEIIHDRVVNSYSGDDEDAASRISFVSVPDGLESGERYIPGKLTETLYQVMPRKIEELIKEINVEEEEEKVSCLVYDQSLGSIQEVAKNMGIGSAAFLPAAAALLVLSFNIPKLIEEGVVDHQGTPLKNNMLQFAPTMPFMSPSDFVWNQIKPKIPTLQKQIFDIMRQNNSSTNSADWLICNSIYDLESGAFTLAQKIVPIGPLLARNRLQNSAGHFIKQESTDSLEWLDQHPPCSVIYVAFGSSTILNETQFEELALGLEQTNRPFFWVVRREKQEFPEGFLERISKRGRITGWAPQQKILSHPSIACFISHCGWNSTVESVSNGIPILCCPYFADQFMNQSYICDIWRVGLPLKDDQELKKNIDLLLGDDGIKERALHMKEMIVSSARDGGNSYKNLRNFISWIHK